MADFPGVAASVRRCKSVDLTSDIEQSVVAFDHLKPLRKRERMMQGFRSTGGLERFISVFSAVRNFAAN
ncbi:hypothetical protein B5K06_33345 [Rhizobium grahamii]|uniref:Transposase n=1 Tax=Rhizobium grahamii TaxID=1120045 RepID=A0A370KFK4_9HYPH|nr:hypothetical protein B5K06_33345 [Rhizobium grahamii]